MMTDLNREGGLKNLFAATLNAFRSRISVSKLVMGFCSEVLGGRGIVPKYVHFIPSYLILRIYFNPSLLFKVLF